MLEYIRRRNTVQNMQQETQLLQKNCAMVRVTGWLVLGTLVLYTIRHWTSLKRYKIDTRLLQRNKRQERCQRIIIFTRVCCMNQST